MPFRIVAADVRRRIHWEFCNRASASLPRRLPFQQTVGAARPSARVGANN